MHQRPDYVLMLPWKLQDEIRFVTPLPSVRVDP